MKYIEGLKHLLRKVFLMTLQRIEDFLNGTQKHDLVYCNDSSTSIIQVIEKRSWKRGYLMKCEWIRANWKWSNRR